jgi:hypothetical protein
MNLKNTNNTIITNLTYKLNNLNDYFIQIDYFDKKGTKKYKNNVPLKYVFDDKSNSFEDNFPN